jgi:uncharacterized protein YfiM (DUF2279 family)
MENRKRIMFGIMFGIALGPLLGSWLSARSGALWWQVLPWVLLAVLWTGIGLMRWRRRGASHRA